MEENAELGFRLKSQQSSSYESRTEATFLATLDTAVKGC